ncbi:hypothetical protein P280DRAFT_293752 [Massarina eburnea CBS 473.64]|uniref:Uncharacterized protein n=1 Tax=Massarina eburnea CBS 473.64 TaxID=1395130 RepID=A0A6A6S2S9_9PLEO|nr:hypothetical protein P280DRAFT_293752 [Massarina eburnea CBS 473.64]
MRSPHHHAPFQTADVDSHRNKRLYQPPITTFFAYRDLDSETESDFDGEQSSERGLGPIIRSQHQHHASFQSARRSQQPRDSLIPDLPDRVQADLLSVGMRVRKSVPEGYKTHKALSIPSITTTLAIAGNGGSKGTTTMTETNYSVKPPQDAVPDDYQHQRELLPYCGLQKIGGYAEQPVTNVHLYGGTSASGERALNFFPLPAEAFTQPFSSQSSTDSSFSMSSLRPNPTNPYKRSWNDEDDKPVKLNSDFFFKIPVKVSEDDIPVSPMSETPPPNSIHAFPGTPLRPFAQPKTRRQAAGRAMDLDGMVVKESGDVDMDLENAGQPDRRRFIGSPGDFGEAVFLHPSWAGNREVDMGGV